MTPVDPYESWAVVCVCHNEGPLPRLAKPIRRAAARDTFLGLTNGMSALYVARHLICLVRRSPFNPVTQSSADAMNRRLPRTIS